MTPALEELQIRAFLEVRAALAALGGAAPCNIDPCDRKAALAYMEKRGEALQRARHHLSSAAAYQAVAKGQGDEQGDQPSALQPAHAN